jgi:hypothetical protein
VILHGSRSGHAELTRKQEYDNTVGWAANPSNVLGWTLTCGEDEYTRHVDEQHWGWSAYDASKVYLACEFAQADTLGSRTLRRDGPRRYGQNGRLLVWLAAGRRLAGAHPGPPGQSVRDSAVSTIRDLLETFGRTVALRVAVELDCGLADRARIERCADEVLRELEAKQESGGRDTLEREIDG